MQAYLVALVILGASVAAGHAILWLCGWTGWSGAAPAVGLATLLIVAAAAVKLPANATTAAGVLALVTIASVAVLWRSRAKRDRLALEVPCAGVLALAVAAIPFVAQARIGLLGVGINNDNAVHLVWTEALRSDLMAQFYGIPNYPLGPHSLMASLAAGTGIPTDTVLTGLLIAIPALTAMTACVALDPLPRLLRAPAAVLVAFTYMLSAWYAQGAFKEPLMALLVLAFVVVLAQWLREPRRSRLAAIPLGLLLAGAVLTYSYAGVAWAVAACGLVAALLFITNIRRPKRIIAGVRAAFLPVVFAALAALVAIAVRVPDLIDTFRVFGTSPADSGDGPIATTNIGNLIGPLPLEQAFGIWPTGDFRQPAVLDVCVPAASAVPGCTAIGMQEPLQLLAIAAVIFGVVWCLLRREFVLPAAIVGALAIYVVAERRESPYIAAKTLVVMAPLLTLVALRALLATWGQD
ncbi:MAG: hypothetical protein H0W96_03605, partial [Solirubrobacterales bacterium]|nr:hypothetical protein [Solirubrobacterales bacterium]